MISIHGKEITAVYGKTCSIGCLCWGKASMVCHKQLLWNWLLKGDEPWNGADAWNGSNN